MPQFPFPWWAEQFPPQPNFLTIYRSFPVTSQKNLPKEFTKTHFNKLQLRD